MTRILRGAYQSCAILALSAVMGASLNAQVVLYVPAQSSNQLWEYGVTSGNGSLFSYPTQSTSGNAPNVVAVTPNNRFMYAGDGDGNIEAFLVNYDGTLVPVGPPLAQGGNVRGLASDATGRFLYASNAGGNELRSFSIDQTTGRLTIIPGNSVSLGASRAPHGMTISSTGRLYVALSGTNQVAQYSVNTTTGALTLIAADIATGGTRPEQVAVNPAGTFLYVTNNQSNNVTMFSINGAGALTSLGVISTGAFSFPLGITVHNNGNFAIVALSSPVSPNVLVFSISGGGILTPAGSGVAGFEATGVTVDPSGRYVYVSNATSNSISGFSINQQTGALTQTSPATFATGSSPQYLLSRPVPVPPAVPAASTWSLAGLGMLLAASSAFLYRRAYSR